MEYNATYTISAGPLQPAAVTLLKDKLRIDIRNNDGETRTIYWYYDQIGKDWNSDLKFAYLAYPPQAIELQSRDLSELLSQRMDNSKKAFFSRRRSALLKVATAMMLLLALAYFFLLPWLATLLAGRFPLSYERSLGDEMYNAMKGSFEVDAARTRQLNAFFRQLEIPSRYPVTITVVRSKEANAFAIPGGHIVVYDKILNGLSSYPEVAALLAHEFVHVENRHSLKSLFRQLSSSLFLSLLIGDAGAVTSVLAANADNLKSLSYSRRLEKEADERGLALLAERGIDCHGFVRLFQLLKKENAETASEWISSHPNLDNRIKNIRQNSLCRQQQARQDTVLHHLFLQLQTSD